MPPETKQKQEQKKGKKRKVEEVEEVAEPNPTEPESTESVDERGDLENISSDSEDESEATQPEKKPENDSRRDRFRDYYMRMLTEEFGDDLDALRKDKKLDATGSLPILIRGLEQGMNIFSAEERKLLLDES